MSVESSCLKPPFRDKVRQIIMFIHSYYKEAKKYIMPTGNYMEIMEDILTLYMNIELELIQYLNRRIIGNQEYFKEINATAQRISTLLSIIFDGKDRGCFHVLLKLKAAKREHPCEDVLKKLYQ